MMFKGVDLPLPEGPNKTATSPAWIGAQRADSNVAGNVGFRHALRFEYGLLRRDLLLRHIGALVKKGEFITFIPTLIVLACEKRVAYLRHCGPATSSADLLARAMRWVQKRTVSAA
jgi:hypothetical protein